MINIRNLDPNKFKIDEKSYKNVLIPVPLYLIISKINGYFKDIRGNKYLTLVLNNESKEIIKKHEELGSKIRDLIRLMNNETYMKIKFNSSVSNFLVCTSK